MCRDAGWVRRVRTNWSEPSAVACVACDLVLNRRVTRVLGQGGLPPGARNWTFDTFPVDPDKQAVFDRVQGWAMTDPAMTGSLLLHGSWGVGKTSLAISAFRYRIEHGTSNGLFSSVPSLLARVKRTYDRDNRIADQSEWEVLEAIRECGLLVLDDLGAERETEWSVDKLAQIIAHRHDWLKPTIFTSNYDMDSLVERLGERSFWRVKEMCWPHVIEMSGRNLRE